MKSNYKFVKNNTAKIAFVFISILFFMFFVTYSFNDIYSKINVFNTDKIDEINTDFSCSTNSQNLINYLETIENIVIKEIIYDESQTKKIRCVGKVDSYILNDNSVLYITKFILSSQLVFLHKIFFLFIYSLIFLFVFYYEQLINLYKKSKTITLKSLNDKREIIYLLIFLNVVYFSFLDLYIYNIELLRFSKPKVVFELFLVVIFPIKIFLIFYILKKLNSIRIVEVIFSGILIFYPIVRGISQNAFSYLFAFVIAYLFISLWKSKIKNFIFIYLIFFTAINIISFGYKLIDSPFINEYLKVEYSKVDQSLEHSEKLDPVVIILFDEFPNASLINEDLTINDRFPSFQQFGKDSYYFPFNHSVASHSQESIESLFNMNEFFAEINESYLIKTIEPITSVCMYRNCNLSKPITKAEHYKDYLAIYLNFYNFIGFEEYIPNVKDSFGLFWIDNQEIDRPVSWENDFEILLHELENISNNDLILAHIIAPHVPWKKTSEGVNYFNPSPNKRSILIDDQKSWNSIYGSNQELQLIEINRFFQQLEYLDSKLMEIIDTLKANNMYDKSTIIISADHGINFIPNNSLRSPNTETLSGIYNTPLFIKPSFSFENEIVVKKVVSNKVITRFVKNNINNEIDMNNFIENFTSDNKINLVGSEKNIFETDKDEYIFNTENFIRQVYRDTELFRKARTYNNDNYGWKLYRNEDLGSEFTPLNINIYDNKNTFYFLGKVMEEVKSVSVLYDSKFKTTDVFRIDGSNYFLILFENVLNDNGISTVKFYFSK